jgi:hypothetical protein
MNIINLFHGRKPAAQCFFLISICFLFISCKEPLDYPSEYIVAFSNQYFETIDSVEISGNIFKNIDIDSEIIIEHLISGKHTIIIVTKSKLLISSVLNLNGTKPNIFVVLTEEGLLQLK